MSRRLTALLVTAAMAVPALASAEVFQRVTQVRRSRAAISITGIPVGSENPVTIAWRFQDADATARAESCERMAIVAMNKPGRWRFEAVRLDSDWIDSCALISAE